MKYKRILALVLAVAACFSLVVTASAADVKASSFRDFDRSSWYAEAVSAAVENGLLYGKGNGIIDPNGNLTRAEMAAIINRAFGCYKTADISQYKDVTKNAWYYKDVQLAVQMGTYNGRSSASMAPDAPITRQEAMTVVARALQLDLERYGNADLSKFSDRGQISNWALPYVKAMVGADYIHGRTSGLAPQDTITRAEFAQIFYNILKHYVVTAATYDKDFSGNVLIRCADVTLKDLTVDGDLILGNGVADGKITLDNVTVTGRLVVWGGGTKAVYCNNGTNMPEVVVCRVDDAVKVYYDRESTLAVIDDIKVEITDRAKVFKETEVIFYDVSGLREAQKQLNAIVEDNQIAFTAPAHLYALVGETSVKAEFINNSKSDSYTVEIHKNSDNALIVDTFELAAGKSISSLELLEAPTFGDTLCTVTVTATRNGKSVGTLHTELTLHAAYLWPEEVR
ncbi:MAG: S-layer homology domain-containing protein [Candidatus Ventricola sp.]